MSAPRRQRELHLRSPAERRVDTVVLAFSEARGRLVNVWLEGAASPVSPGQDGCCVEVPLGRETIGRRLRLTVTWEGVELPHLEAVEWAQAGQVVQVGATTAATATSDDGLSVLRRIPELAKIRYRRRKALETLCGLSMDELALDPVGRGSRLPDAQYFVCFFYEFDRRTHPKLMRPKTPEELQVRNDVLAVGELLLERLRRRWAMARGEAEVEPPAALHPERAALNRLADLLRDLLLVWFPGDEHGLDTQRLTTAFEAFACGDLVPADFDPSTGTWAAQPDSSNCFMLCEFSLAVLEAAQRHAGLGAGNDPADVDRWSWLGQLFSLVERLFVEAYGRTDWHLDDRDDEEHPAASLGYFERGPPPLERPSGSCLHDEAWRRERRREAFSGEVTVEALHARHLQLACPERFD